MTAKESATKPSSTEPWTDPDDAPELDDHFFERADLYDGGTLIQRGRPALEQPEREVTLRLDADVLEGLRATGPGWQTRINQALRDWLKTKAA